MSAQIFHSLAEARHNFGPAALAIGNFDGVHIGHKALIEAMCIHARLHSLRTAVLTFHPHPTVLVAPDRVPPMLTTLEERLALLQQLGVERILVLPFTHEIARLTPHHFVSDVLVDSLNTKAAFVGNNFNFGYRQTGTAALLAELGHQYNFATAFLNPVTYKGSVVSSTAIRQALLNDKLLFASRLLGRCFSVSGAVVKGQGIGRRETVPTLNLCPAPGQIQLPGVHITRTFDLDSNRTWPSITNVGTRPTFDGESITIETFLLSPLTANTPANVRIEFRRFVRPERKFDNPDALKQQILRDVSRAQTYWRRLGYR